MDIIYLRELRIDTVIGVYDWEKRIKQTLVFDVELGTDIRRAAASDAVADTLDYKAVADRIVEFAGTHSFELVETLAERVAGLLIEEFQVPWLRLSINKPGAVPRVRDMGVRIERHGSRPS